MVIESVHIPLQVGACRDRSWPAAAAVVAAVE